jgi:3-oxoacyl-[acyl-carrier protein] reductase
MDLGIRGRSAIVCASSGGLGKACATALACEGVEVVINGRDPSRVAQTSAQIETVAGRAPRGVVADINTLVGREALLAACPDADILVTNNGGPPVAPPEWDRDAWLAALEANLLAPSWFITKLVPGMRQRGFGRVVNITSAVVKSPQLSMSLSATARAGLTAFAKGLSREAARDNVTINNLLPQHIDTGRQQEMAAGMMRERGISHEEARAWQIRSVRAGRLGRPEEVGDTCAFLCSVQAGFISGQSLLVDGGSYPGLL